MKMYLLLETVGSYLKHSMVLGLTKHCSYSGFEIHDTHSVVLWIPCYW